MFRSVFFPKMKWIQTFLSLHSNEISMMIKSYTENFFCTTLKCLKKFYEGLSPLSEASLCEICKNWGFCWSVFSCIRTYSWILSLYGKIQVSENPYFCLYYAVLCNRSVHVFLQKCIQNPMKHLSCYCTKNEVFHSRFLWWWYVGGTVWRHRLFLNVLFRQ